MSIIKESTRLKEELLKRLIELYPKGKRFNNAEVIKDAEERSFKLASGAMSRYFSDKPQKNTLSDEQILWLALRYGIPVQLAIGVPVVNGDKVDFIAPRFDELKSLKMLKQVFEK
jgi:hypothetical protein